MDRAALAAHLLRFALPVAAMIRWPACAPLAALATYLAGFMLTHELAHGALGLPRRANELALAIAGAAIAVSGHGLRRTHLHHHARPFADDDLEGLAARTTAWRALLTAPCLALRLVATAWRTASPRDRRWQRIEHAAVAALVAAAVLGPAPLRLYLITAITAQVFAPFWLGHLIHRPPAWLFAVARVLARAGSTTMRTFVLHAAHHTAPKLATHRLDLASALDTRAPGHQLVGAKAASAPARRARLLLRPAA